MNQPNDKIHHQTDQELIDEIRNSRDRTTNGLLFKCLRNRYLPLIKSWYSKCYARGVAFDDWVQEASIVLMLIIDSFNYARRISFGTYYKRCLRNHFYDLIRGQHANKRIPNNCLTSYNANQNYYDDVLGDVKAIHPERSVIITDVLKRLMKVSSIFENKVTVGMLHQRSFEEIAEDNHCSVVKVKNAYERCKRKYNKMRDSKLN